MFGIKINHICIIKICRKEFQKVYERLNIKGLEERGESYYQDRMDAVVKLLNEKGEWYILHYHLPVNAVIWLTASYVVLHFDLSPS